MSDQFSVEFDVVFAKGHTESGNLVSPTFKGTCRIPKKTRANWVGIAAHSALQLVSLKS